MFDQLIKNWDGETVIIHYDRPSDSWIFVAIHSTRLGPAMGGTRLKHYPNPAAALEDALRLSTAMTYKYAVPGILRGGGKTVICVSSNLDSASRTTLLREFGKLLRQLGGLFSTGPDIGTSPEDMDIIAQTGDPFVFCRTPANGGAGSSGPITALGVFTGIQVAAKHCFGDSSLQGKQVLVQGVGSVGATLIEYLRKAGAEILFSDVDETAIRHFRDDLGLAYVPPEAVYTTRCDIFSPNAMGGILNAETIPQLNCRVIVGGANNQLATPQDAELLKARNILFAPDYVVSVGAVLAIPLIEREGWSQEKAEKEVIATITKSLTQVIELAAQKNITTEAAARMIADERLAAAR